MYMSGINLQFRYLREITCYLWLLTPKINVFPILFQRRRITDPVFDTLHPEAILYAEGPGSKWLLSIEIFAAIYLLCVPVKYVRIK